MLEKTTRINYLFDFYQSLLTPKQRDYMELYYLEDYSLGEISETFEVSRQAVYDNIRRTEKLLEDYESKLQLYGKFKQRNHLIKEIETEVIKRKLDEPFQKWLTQLQELE